VLRNVSEREPQVALNCLCCNAQTLRSIPGGKTFDHTGHEDGSGLGAQPIHAFEELFALLLSAHNTFGSWCLITFQVTCLGNVLDPTFAPTPQFVAQLIAHNRQEELLAVSHLREICLVEAQIRVLNGIVHLVLAKRLSAGESLQSRAHPPLPLHGMSRDPLAASDFVHAYW
jgi:hypothetical protein